MRFFSLVAPLFALSVGLVDATAQPRSAHGLSQMTRRELELRANHPDLFNKRDKGDAQPSSGSAPPECDFFPPPRKREVEQVLNAREMASFLVGRGTFTSPNGTAYEDHDYVAKQRRALAIQKRRSYHHIYDIVVDSLGNKLLQVSIPHYKKWKSTVSEEELIYLSPMTAIRGGEIDELEKALLDDPNFEDIQVHGFRITRTFFEVVRSY